MAIVLSIANSLSTSIKIVYGWTNFDPLIGYLLKHFFENLKLWLPYLQSIEVNNILVLIVVLFFCMLST